MELRGKGERIPSRSSRSSSSSARGADIVVGDEREFNSIKVCDYRWARAQHASPSGLKRPKLEIEKH